MLLPIQQVPHVKLELQVRTRWLEATHSPP
jgi:hypothetical protein